MGNKLLTREEFEASIKEILERHRVNPADIETVLESGKIRKPMNIGPGEACPHCGRTEPRNRFG